MNKMDFKMPLGAFIHLLAVIWISMEPRYEGLFVWMLPFLALNLVGMLLVMLDTTKLVPSCSSWAVCPSSPSASSVFSARRYRFRV